MMCLPAGMGMVAPVAAAALSYDATILSLNPWGYWKLDELNPGAASTAADASPNARDGTYSNALTSAAGLFASSTRSQTFATGRVSLPNYTLPATPQFSIVAFLDTGALASDRQILSADDAGSNRRWQFRLFGGNAQLITIDPATTTTPSSAFVNDDTPHMVALVFDQSLSAGAGRVKIYVDGSVNGASTTAITITPGTANLAIASRSNAGSAGTFGRELDNVAFFTTPLSAANIAALWDARNTP